MEFSWELRKTSRNCAAADLIISESGVAVVYRVYLQNGIRLIFQTTDRTRAELAARLLRLAGVAAEVRKAVVGGRDVWYVQAYTDVLAAGREELRRALAGIVEAARGNGWVDEKRAEKWLKKLERGRVLKEGWPKYFVRLTGGNALEARFGSTNLNNIMREAQRLREMGLEEDRHFSVKMPEEGRNGYVYIRREGLAYAAWLSVHGSEDQRKLAAEFISYILERAREVDKDVYERVREVVEEGRARGSLTLKGFEKEVEVDGRRLKVKVIDGEAELEESRSGKKLLWIRIVAEVDSVRCEYVITYGRYGRKNEVAGYAVARADAPGGREADAERLVAVVEALTGRRPRVNRKKNGALIIMCGREHLEGFRRFAELADAVERWLNGQKLNYR
jgi:methyl coenzyme M reductase subunit D